MPSSSSSSSSSSASAAAAPAAAAAAAAASGGAAEPAACFYCATSQPPTAVTHAAVGAFLAEGEPALVLAKTSRLEVYRVRAAAAGAPEALELAFEAPLNGRVGTLGFTRVAVSKAAWPHSRERARTALTALAVVPAPRAISSASATTRRPPARPASFPAPRPRARRRRSATCSCSRRTASSWPC